jgi:hypothetical protein
MPLYISGNPVRTEEKFTTADELRGWTADEKDDLLGPRAGHGRISSDGVRSLNDSVFPNDNSCGSAAPDAWLAAFGG